MVSVATLGESKFRLGPVQRTGTTPSSAQVATTVSSLLFTWMVAVHRLTPPVMLANHFAIFAVSGPSGRVNLTLEYFNRVGSCQTKVLFPPSSRCSITTSQPRPSQLLKVPSSLLSILRAKQTLSPGSASFIAAPYRRRSVSRPARSRSSRSSAFSRAASGPNNWRASSSSGGLADPGAAGPGCADGAADMAAEDGAPSAVGGAPSAGVAGESTGPASCRC